MVTTTSGASAARDATSASRAFSILVPGTALRSSPIAVIEGFTTSRRKALVLKLRAAAAVRRPGSARTKRPAIANDILRHRSGGAKDRIT